MRKLSAAVALATTAILLASPAAIAQSTGTGGPSSGNTTSPQLAPPAGTNSAGTAQSSGERLNTDEGVTTGAANSQSIDRAIADENRSVDRRLKSICRGC
jgi:hypothetical protein